MYIFTAQETLRTVVEFQSLYGYEVTWKIKELEVEGGTCPSAP